MLQRRPFGESDDVREIPYGRLETYDMGDIRSDRSVLQPRAASGIGLEVRAAVHTGETLSGTNS